MSPTKKAAAAKPAKRPAGRTAAPRKKAATARRAVAPKKVAAAKQAKRPAGRTAAPGKKAATARRAVAPKKAAAVKKGPVKTAPGASKKATPKKAPSKTALSPKVPATRTRPQKAPSATVKETSAAAGTRKETAGAAPPKQKRASESNGSGALGDSAQPRAGQGLKGRSGVSQARQSAKQPVAPKPAPRPTRGPYAGDEKFLEEQRQLLLSERLVYQHQAEDLRAEAESLALEREPGDVQFDEESGEGGTVAVDRERDLTLSAQALATIEEIDVALAAIESKTYGACENCGQPIPKARLRALPYARLCVACKSGGLHRR